ncbi:tetratricopeptide repeat protein [Micromonospora deserti]|uniref:Tetratrico peptide repeat group 5 domain-containing protein n=1 Tax=Micromonospora deserti TaxID=2070366 RepID=A0A2W2CNN0_9ACTN|nr:tetratricopeptide repeat protein [Micromonospora deserti]PZG01082.1 hypothetical protein C1I99_08270 [Micromonospora deserti]
MAWTIAAGLRSWAVAMMCSAAIAAGLADARAAFLALALVDASRAREAVVEALTALAPHLTQYGRLVHLPCWAKPSSSTRRAT